MSTVLTRRTLIKVAGGLATGAALAACGGRVTPTSANPRIKLTLQSLVSGNPTAQRLLQQAVTSFTAQNPGVDVQVVDRQFAGNIPRIIAGASDDIIWDNNPAAYLGSSKLLLNLDPYIQRDNVDTSAWSAGQIQSYKLAGSNSLYMLPAYMGPFCYTVRLDDFDDAGIPYPDPDWDHQAFAAVARQLTQIKNGKRRYGTVVNYYSNGSMQTVTFMLAGFGGSMTDSSGTRQTLGTPQAIAAGQWLFEELLLPGYAVTRDNAYAHPGGYDGFLVGGGASMQQIWTQVLQDAQTYGTQFKWDYYPFPVLPHGRLTYGTLDFYGISATTKYPEQAWELLKWVSYAPDMQRALMRVWGQTPALNALWQEWQSVIVSIAPIMAKKQLHWFHDAAAQGYAMPQQFFRYADAQANQIQGQWLAKIMRHELDVAEAFAQADHQVNAMLATAAALEAQVAKTRAQVDAIQPGPNVAYPAPPRAGLGVAATAGASYIAARDGAYTMLGDGTDMWGTSDNATFAAVAATASEGAWTCRVTSIANLTCPKISGTVKVGIMARGDLSDNAPAVAALVAPDGSLRFQSRAVDSISPVELTSVRLKDGSGNPAILATDVSKPASNYLVQPVWLQLKRQGELWSAFASLDGKQWTPLGTPQTVKMGGAWIGIAACAHNADFQNQGYVRATFDHLSFQPTDLVQLGSQGIPPAAGPVPADWVTRATGATATR